MENIETHSENATAANLESFETFNTKAFAEDVRKLLNRSTRKDVKKLFNISYKSLSDIYPNMFDYKKYRNGETFLKSEFNNDQGFEEVKNILKKYYKPFQTLQGFKLVKSKTTYITKTGETHIYENDRLYKYEPKLNIFDKLKQEEFFQTIMNKDLKKSQKVYEIYNHIHNHLIISEQDYKVLTMSQIQNLVYRI